MIGTAVVWVSFLAALASAFLYYRSVSQPSLVEWARRTFSVSATGIVLAGALLMTYILQHRFEYAYVSNYSSRDLPTALLVTTFWAGQEGSFMLWSLFAAVIGIFLIGSARRAQMEREVMTVYSGILGFLLLFLAAKSPFQYLWEAFPKEIQPGFVPQDGRGLNPLLQNFWMIIHPPVLFLGFAALAVPFSMAVASLWQRRYSEWIRRTIPWVLFSALALGAGLILGGYWAYGVLGWGGWWGWDPVENSSLIPWIVSVILVHTMLIQMLTGRLVRANFILSVFGFLLVVYSTFLTRSGVLAEASVHSFVDPGMFAYSLLMIWLVLSAVVGFGMVWLRRKDLVRTVPASRWMTRESMLTIAAIVMGTSAVIILFGTSWPMLSPGLSKLFALSKGAVEPSFYDRTNLPLAALMVVLLALSLKVKWNEESAGFLSRLLVPLIGSVVLLVLLVLAGLRDVQGGILAWAALLALLTALEHGYRLAKQQPWFLGGALAHAGLAMLLLGIIASGRYGVKQSASLPLNQPKDVFGYRLTYLGTEEQPDGKMKFRVKAEKDGSSFVLSPVMYESSYNNSLMRNPDYMSFLTRDFYIEPVMLEQGAAAPQPQQIIELTKGEKQTIGPMEVTFVRFQTNPHSMSPGAVGKITIGAVLDVKSEKIRQEVIPVTMYAPGGAPEEVKTAYLKDSQIGFQLLGMNIDPTSRKSAIQINLVGLHGMPNQLSTPPTLMTEVSVKPFMSFVWTAAALIMAGLALAMVRRVRQEAA